MTELFNIDISELPVQVLFVEAFLVALVYVILYLVKRYLFVLVKSETWNQRIQKSWPRIELIIWLTIFFLTVVYLLNQSFFITVILLALIFIIGGRSWRDVISGITLRLENRMSKGDFVNSENYQGVVESMGLRGIVLRLNNGENAFVPYRLVTEFTVRKLERSVKSEMTSFEVTIKPEFTLDTAIQKLKVEILQIPYVLLTQPVQIEVVKADENGSVLRAVIFTQSHDSGKLAEKAIYQALNQLKLIVT